MTPTRFPQANVIFGPPPDLDESQCMAIPAYQGTIERGALEGARLVIVAWQPSAKELEALAAGAPVFLSMIGGLQPHFLTTDFGQASHLP